MGKRRAKMVLFAQHFPIRVCRKGETVDLQRQGGLSDTIKVSQPGRWEVEIELWQDDGESLCSFEATFQAGHIAILRKKLTLIKIVVGLGSKVGRSHLPDDNTASNASRWVTAQLYDCSGAT
jgi:hypothetical protein